MKPFLRDLIWIVPASLGLGALLSVLSAGTWWIGWLAFSLFWFLGLSALAVLWRGAGAGRTLGLMLLLTVLLRLSLGMALSWILPVYGYSDKVDKAGYVFQDAYDRDEQAWRLADSTAPLWKAFDKTYSKDQYGGLLAFSAMVYRGPSPDAHRPWLIVLLAALTAAVGVALAWRAVRLLWGDALANPTAWILALFPESILLGSSQMREPFLITFVIMLFWGIVDLQLNHHRSAWAWMAGALAGMLFVSPGIAVFALVGLGGWAWMRRPERRIPWRLVLAGLGVLAVALVLLGLGLARGVFAGATPLALLTVWLPVTANWDASLAVQASGWLQKVFAELPQPLWLPFMTGYGLTQPLLPAAVFDPATWVWRSVAIFRAAGWYVLLPFLAAGLIAVWKMPEKNERRAWIWLWIVTWAWIILSSYRAGGDQWDNPRYRTWFLLWEALLAAQAFVWWRRTRNPWMVRLMAVEGIFLVFFGIWYSSRYGNWANSPLHVFIVIAAILAAGGLVLLAGWLQDKARKKRGERA